MICEKCEAEMTLRQEIPLNFTSPEFKKKGYFNVSAIKKNAEMYVCESCGNVQFAPEQDEEEEKQDTEMLKC